MLIESGSAFCIGQSLPDNLHQPAVACLCQDCARYHRINTELRQLYPFKPFGLFPFAGTITRKNNGMLHQKPVNRPYHLETSLLRGNRTKNFAPKIFCTKTNE
ncbi:hypothetical protein [Escherichia albertii]|uniref:hypothetical protein n=1 Tax=Escherichia albertii TaxID=208962 RepID=UPI001E4DC76E|nr:hypothetical protein [Escherichia albertii]MCU7276009.1 hypothetical protein [Escherichia albertii]MCZ8759253.1 hypothetical protein [Escherichia albertii]MCZ9089244.1 hypothetical protein [Escherichia albertii]MDD9759596.1 hypothetical protein [Escherichia albertii]